MACGLHNFISLQLFPESNEQKALYSYSIKRVFQLWGPMCAKEPQSQSNGWDTLGSPCPLNVGV